MPRGDEHDPDRGEAALIDLFERHMDDVYRFVLARTGSDAVAEDVSSEVFVSAARRLAAQPDAVIDVRWLMGVARNRLIDVWRRDERERRRIARVAAEPVHDGVDAAHTDRVLRALQSLPERQRACVAMRYLDELGVAEIADRLDLTYRTAESLLARGRRNLRRALEEGR